MERAGRVLNKLRPKSSGLAGCELHHLTPKAWRAAVGPAIARHSRAVFLEGKHLTVEVEDAIWQAQLSALRDQVLYRLEKIIGPNAVSSIRFRVAVERRMPVSEQVAVPDEADRILDPTLRYLYKNARRKANE